MLPLLGGLVSGGLGLIGAGMQSSAAQRSSDAQTRATQQAIQLQRDQYNQTRRDLDPWRMAGAGALNRLSGMAGNMSMDNFNFQADPGYEFRLGEGRRALEASAAARGGYFSGQTGKELAQYGQGLASDEFGRAYDRWNNMNLNNYGQLYDMSNMGLGAAGQTGQFGAGAATNMGNAAMQGGQAQGAGMMGQANAWSAGLQNVGNQLMGGLGAMQQYQMMNRMYPSGYERRGMPLNSMVLGPAYPN